MDKTSPTTDPDLQHEDPDQPTEEPEASNPPPTDPDLRHLADLINLLPPPDEREFWEQVSVLNDCGLKYLFEKIVGNDVLRQPAPERNAIHLLAGYLLYFFGGDHPTLAGLIARNLKHRWVNPGACCGQIWLDDLVATSWRLYVRYQFGEARLEAWPASFTAWWRQHLESRATDSA